MRILMIVIALLSALPGWAGTESNSGNGGYFCHVGDEKPLPCDFFFEQRGYELPYLASQEFRYGDLRMAIREEFESIVRLIENRGAGWVDFNWLPPESIRFFDTSTFLGHDPQFVGEEIQQEQVGYAYWYNRVDTEDLSKKERVRIIELDLSYLKDKSPRNQALALLHEYLHHMPQLDHSLISPLIRALRILLSIRDEQLRGRHRQLTREELKASQDFQALLVHLGVNSDVYHQLMVIHQPGGGVLVYKEKVLPFSDKNFVGVGSAVRNITSDAAYYTEGLQVVDEVTALDSQGRFHPLNLSKLSVGMERVTGLEGDTDYNVTIQGDLAPLSWCVDYDSEAQCRVHVDLLPIEFETHAGDDNKLQKLGISLSRVRGKFGDDSSCQIQGGYFTHEQLRRNLGSMKGGGIMGAKCDFMWNTIANGNLKMRLHFDLSAYGAPGNGGYGEIGGAVGIKILKQVAIDGVLKGGITDMKSIAMYGRTNYGLRLKLDLPSGFHLQGEWIKGRYFTEDLKSKSNPPEVHTLHEQVLGLSLGGTWESKRPAK
jgi:hypothetical protein